MGDTAAKIPMFENVPAATVLAGAAERDITPPIGIYNRLWGAAKHDVAQGIHRPLVTSVLAVRAADGDGSPFLLVSLDASWFRSAEDDWIVRGALVEGLGIDVARVIVNCTHTHATCSISLTDSEKPGGEMIAPYQRAIRDATVEAARAALAAMQPCTMTWATGRCNMAGNRNMPDPEKPRLLCGFNPLATTDDTVLVGRVTRDSDDAPVATVVNYACHPTTLAWENDLISPDFIGGMREVVQQHTKGVPCLFLQGASGDVGPREQYTGNVEVADANGRQLGFAALSAIASMRPPRQRLAYRGPVESGAPLAVWRAAPFEASKEVGAEIRRVALPLKPRQSEAELQKQIAAATDRLVAEKLYRLLLQARNLGTGTHIDTPVWFWRLGGALVVAYPYEAFTELQVTLRAAFPDFAVVVMNVANGFAAGYICPAEIYDWPPIYQVTQSPLTRDGHAVFVSACKEGLAAVAI